MSDPFLFDIIVIGSGPGGQKAAVQGAKAGRRVAVVEMEREVGGACLYRGTIPSKTLREVALNVSRMRQNASVFEFRLREDLEVSQLMQRLDEVLVAHARFIRDQLHRNGIHRVHGRARLHDRNTVQVQHLDGSVSLLRADVIVLAPGSRPRTPSDIPIDHENILDSDSILSMIYLPRSLTVLGGGVIASEYATVFSLLGVEVTIIDRAPRPLMFLDAEQVAKFVDNFRRHGGRYLGEQEIVSVIWDGTSQVVTHLADGTKVAGDKMLVALGRVANVEGLGLEVVGIEQTSRGHILVDSDYRTSVPNIYAVGDVIGPPSLASCSMEQGRRAMCHALGLDPGRPFELVPIGIYAVPEMASVGLTEAQAREQFGDVIVGRALFEEVARGQIAGAQDGQLKMIADPDGRKLLGVQVVGDGATDLIHIGEMALINNDEIGIFLENILNFPTFSEAYRIAALDIQNQVFKREPERAG